MTVYAGHGPLLPGPHGYHSIYIIQLYKQNFHWHLHVTQHILAMKPAEKNNIKINNSPFQDSEELDTDQEDLAFCTLILCESSVLTNFNVFHELNIATFIYSAANNVDKIATDLLWSLINNMQKNMTTSSTTNMLIIYWSKLHFS